MILETILVCLSVFSITMIFAYIKLTKRLNKVSFAFSEMYKDYVIVQDFFSVENTSNAIETDNDIHRENFIKFLSQSRDWAFEYIEDVHSTLKKFINEVQPQLDYYKKYGIVVEGIIPPHDFALKKIAKEIDELKKLLPEESSDRR